MKDFFLILLLFFLDQISKTYIVNSMILNSSLEISSYFNIVFIYNRGFLFGYLSNLPESLLFYIHFILFLASIYIIYKFLYVKQSTRIISLFLFAGALGNSFDRLFRNGVVDFLDFHYLDIHWPAFNLADSYILISVIIYLIKHIRSEKIVHRNC
jgi:signal peptidase II